MRFFVFDAAELEFGGAVAVVTVTDAAATVVAEPVTVVGTGFAELDALPPIGTAPATTFALRGGWEFSLLIVAPVLVFVAPF